MAGHRGDEALARSLASDPDPRVRATALGALARLDRLTDADLLAALDDADPTLRRRACELAAAGGGARWVGVPEVASKLVCALDDADDATAEMAAWALGELAPSAAVEPLCRMATGHRDALCREAAVAALGAIGDVAGLPAILTATGDKPPVRRRAVLALAPFDGPEVEAALQAALADRDWQVRQAAEDLRAAGA